MTHELDSMQDYEDKCAEELDNDKEPWYCECQGLSVFCDKCREVEHQEMSREA